MNRLDTRLRQALERLLKSRKEPTALLHVEFGPPASRSTETWFVSAWTPTAGVYTFKAALLPCPEAGPEESAAALNLYGPPPGWQPGWSLFKQARCADRTDFADAGTLDPVTKLAFQHPFATHQSLAMFAHHSVDQFCAHVVSGDTVVVNVVEYERVGFDVIAACGAFLGEPVICTSTAAQAYKILTKSRGAVRFLDRAACLYSWHGCNCRN